MTLKDAICPKCGDVRMRGDRVWECQRCNVLTWDEVDPHGKDPHQPGAKTDAGKHRPILVIGSFAAALVEVSKVGTFGAAKYTDDGWRAVLDGQRRYTDAMLRHLLDEFQGERLDPQSKLHHAAHTAWNALARLELLLAAEKEPPE